MIQFAFYLPQFHRIPENDEWWGSGFTEWRNVKNATPLFKGHMQPKVPLDNNYYNLLNKKTVVEQTALLHKYGLSGLIYYHYYFNGKTLLEKPAENLLSWTDISQPFFFCWANHTWYRSWEGSKEVLIEQTYGTESDWEKHFEYLLPFFKDSRYEKKNNKPLFMIFNSEFQKKKEMFDYFEKKCIENGFSGICIIETCENIDNMDVQQKSKSNQCEYLFLREPTVSRNAYIKSLRYAPIRLIRKLKRLLCGPYVIKFNGNRLFDLMCCYKLGNKSIARGVFFEWDNTPRHSIRGTIITPPDKKRYLQYMDSIKDTEYLFINAWNEWAEGMMLEPTVENKYKYLEWISCWIANDKLRGKR